MLLPGRGRRQDRRRLRRQSAQLPALVLDRPQPVEVLVAALLEPRPERRALDVSAALLERGLLVPAIRPPTVAVGASRLRIAVSAAHTPTEVAELIAALGALGVTLDAEVAA